MRADPKAMSKPYSQACENNKAPILAVLKTAFSKSRKVLEIGSGTGQHAVYFAENLPHLTWQPSDQVQYLNGVQHWIDDSQLTNISRPITLDVTQSPWPIQQVDGLFSANTLHIMSWSMVEAFFQGISNILANSGVFCVYGPFNYEGSYTSESNANFDSWLKSRDPLSGIRDIESVTKLATLAGLTLVSDNAMPANNRLLVFHKQVSSDY